MGNVYALRVVGGREKLAAKAIARKVESHHVPIQAILVTEQTKGYIYVEAETIEAIKMILDAPFVMKRLFGKVPFDSVKQYIKPTPMSELLQVGDIVEIISGPFKGQSAKIESVNKKKNSVRVILEESSYRAPVKISAESVKLSERK